MQDTRAAWLPRLGDLVLVSVTGDLGEVTEVTGSGPDQRFVVAIWSPPDSTQHAAPTVMHRVCTRDDLAPARMP
jgi:hypothetical protein